MRHGFIFQQDKNLYKDTKHCGSWTNLYFYTNYFKV